MALAMAVQSSQWRTVGIALGMACLIALAALMFRQGYSEIGPQAYEYATALYSICNRRDESRLEKISELIEKSVADSEITETESRWLNEIIALADDGYWEEASYDTRQLMLSQVKGR